MEKRVVRNEEIDLMKFLYALKNKIWLIITVGLLFACGAAGYTKFYITPTYTSTSTILVLSKETTLTSMADLSFGSQLKSDYAMLITSRPVLEEVVENLELGINYKALKGCIAINNPSDTRLLYISATMQDPKMAKAVVDELAIVSSEYIGDKMEVTPPKIIEEGELPIYSNGPNMKNNVMKGMLIGMALVCGIVVLLEYMNDAVKTEEDIERYLGVPTLALIPDKGLEDMSRKNKKRKKQGKA